MKLDLQVHTFPASADSALGLEKLAEACIDAGIDGVALTEHGPPDPGAEKLLEANGLVHVLAREVSCMGAHLLVICPEIELLRTLPGAMLPTDPILRRPDLALIWAHPAAPGGSSAYGPTAPHPEEVAGMVHCVEVLNGRHLHFADAVTRAEQLAARLGVTRTAGSDAHRGEDVGRCFTRVDSRRSDGMEGIVSALREGRAEPFLSSQWAGLRGYSYRPDLGRYLD